MNKQRVLEIMEITKKTYDLIGQEFSATRDKPWPEMVKLVRQYVKPGDRVLDVGCGNGRLVDVLPKVDYLGVDISKVLLEKLKLKKINYKLLDILELDKLNEAKFEVVCLFAVFNHVASRELRLKVLRDIRGLLKPGGLLIMTNWNLWQLGVKKSVWRPGWPARDVMTIWQSGDGKKQGELYYRGFTRGELAGLLNQAGFKVADNYYALKGDRVNWRQGRNIVTIAQNR